MAFGKILITVNPMCTAHAQRLLSPLPYLILLHFTHGFCMKAYKWGRKQETKGI